MPLKVREIIRMVEADGWLYISQVGSHRQYKHPVKAGRVTIPGKPGGDLNRDLEKSILKQAQITKKESK